MTRAKALAEARRLYGPNVYALGGAGMCAFVLLRIKDGSNEYSSYREVRIDPVVLGVGGTWYSAIVNVRDRTGPKNPDPLIH